MKYLSTPPPTYSRLFRPWDGKTHQDNTITSTTQQLAVAAMNSNDPIRSINERKMRSDNQCDAVKPLPIVPIETPKKMNNLDPVPKKIKVEPPPPFTILSPEQISKKDILSTPPLDYLSAPFYPANPYNDFLIGNAASHATPFIGMDPFLGSMEQEYARVLAEEAQMKMMTARKQRPKKFKCPHCDVAFSNNGQLKGHVRIHTGKLKLNYFIIICSKLN